MESPPQSLSQAVARETSGLTVLWSGRPDSWGYARSQWPRALLGIPFTAFAVFWTWTAFGGEWGRNGKPPPPFFVLWGCMFILFGLSFMLSPVYAFWKSGRVFYVVTDRGAIIFERTWALKIQSFEHPGLTGFERVSRGSQGGDLIFQRTIERRGKHTRVQEVGFIGLRDYSAAESALRSMIKLRTQSA